MILLAISGSLRARSSNTEVLRAAAILAPPSVTVDLFDDLATLPHFNPDLDLEGAVLPKPVRGLRARIAVGLINASPRSTHAQASLAETLRTMSVTLVPGASVVLPLGGRALDSAGIVADTELARLLRSAVDALAVA